MLALSWKEAPDTRRAIRETHKLKKKPFAVNLVLAWNQTERLEACLEEGVKVLSFSWGDPAPYLSRTSEAKATMMHAIASGEEARRIADAAVDVVVAQGWEAGGQVLGKVTTMVLVPCVVDAVAPVAVVAAGGIAHGRGVAAVLVLAAQAVWVGTRFLALAGDEAPAHSEYQTLVLQARETDTAYTSYSMAVGLGLRIA